LASRSRWLRYARGGCPAVSSASAWLAERLRRSWTAAMLEREAVAIGNAAEQRNGPVRIKEESWFLKDLGFGAAVGFWDLPTLMCSHGLSMTRKDAREAGGFVEQAEMNHWGADDLSFGATMIAYGVKVAPALEWQCWHLRQEGREMSRTKQFASRLSRWPHYISSLDRQWPAQCFPRRPIRLVSRQGNLQEFEVA
jgi:hypothetical protein